MSRLLFSAAAAFACVLAVTGCAGLDQDSAPKADVEAAKTASATEGPYAAALAKLPDNLDGEIRRAQLLRASGDFDGAVHSLSQLMLAAPDDPRIVGEYGKVLTQQGRTADALAFLDRAVQLDPGNWTLYSALGVAYDQNDDHAKAAAAYEHALQLKPDEPTVLNNYAVSRMLAGDLDRANDLLQQAAAHGGDYPKIANNLETVAAMRTKSGHTAGSDIPVKPAPAAAVKTGPATPRTREAAKAPVPAAGPRALQPGLAQNHANKSAAHVVMQKVPYDPLAGKVYGNHDIAKTHRLAATEPKSTGPSENQAAAKAEDKVKPDSATAKSSTPALRTAADSY